jgi:hypothetical protein
MTAGLKDQEIPVLVGFTYHDQIIIDTLLSLIAQFCCYRIAQEMKLEFQERGLVRKMICIQSRRAHFPKAKKYLHSMSGDSAAWASALTIYGAHRN